MWSWKQAVEGEQARNMVYTHDWLDKGLERRGSLVNTWEMDQEGHAYVDHVRQEYGQDMGCCWALGHAVPKHDGFPDVDRPYLASILHEENGAGILAVRLHSMGVHRQPY